ncbi:MAG: ATP-binding protein [Clostridiales bacterium]|nr:ATP-binding protein [Clostridiales bacterium]
MTNPNNTEIIIDEEFEKCKKRCEALNMPRDNSDKITDYDCKECSNNQYIFVPKKVNGIYKEIAVPCKCQSIRNTLKRLAESGLKNIIQRYTFESYLTTEKWQIDIKNKAVDFTSQQKKWFYIGGQSGCGKTHLCTSMCGKFLSDGKDVVYMLWLSDVKELKSTVNDYENHKNLIKKYRETEVLYIDDFFKTGKEKDGISLPTSADIQIAYDILNYRYINENLITIISSERSIDDIFKIDEAVGGRILECTDFGKYSMNIKPDKNKNYRRKNITEY